MPSSMDFSGEKIMNYTYPHSSLVPPYKMDVIFKEVLNTHDLGGACAEVGVYKGGTAELLAIHKKERPLYLFDTFAGIPHSGKHDNHHKVGDFSEASFEGVCDRLAKYEGVFIHKGIFPQDTGKVIDDVKFSFVHLDVDVYESYLDGLNFFWPKMIKGGVIICDDYHAWTCVGAKVAVDEFLKTATQYQVTKGHKTFIIKKL